MTGNLRNRLPLAICLVLTLGAGLSCEAQMPLPGMPYYSPSPGPPVWYPSGYGRSRLGTTQSHHVFHWPRSACVKCARPSDVPVVQTISAPCGPFEQGFIQPLPIVEEQEFLMDPPVPMQAPPLAPQPNAAESETLEFPAGERPRSSRQETPRSVLKVRS